MAINFSKNQQPQQNQVIDVSPQAQPQQQFNITTVKHELAEKIINSNEIDKLTSLIDVNNPNTIVSFGGPVAEEISKASDQVLRSMNVEQVNDSGKLLQNLAVIMDQFDGKELSTEEQKGLKKFFSNTKKELDKILGKYHTMGDEIDQIYVQLKGYEKEIYEANTKLETMFNANLSYYNELLKYILAGEQGVKEIDAYIAQLQQQMADNPDDGGIKMELNNIMQVRDILDQRVMDLKVAENVAMQTVPMLKTMEFSNLNLIRKINSAFIVTMPVFKQSLAQAVMLKRQKVQAEAMQALDQKTNEMLIKNAENTVLQSKLTAQMASGSSIQIETLQKTWQTIVDGIEETSKIQNEARQKRLQDTEALKQLNDDFKRRMKA
ncbi:MAG TPA: hypothetical protein DIW26_03600 [Ruminococcus sp.]|nr:hypothetical protein [Ruminococcus sp.]HCR73489.1 hypothetical protein [Ruminococcus sp.]